ncbi:hydroxyacid dehydrogenase [Labrys neptuniae]
MPHVLVAGRIHEAGLEQLRTAPGISLTAIDEVSTASYAPFIADADALLIRTQPLPAAVVAKAPRLRIVSRHGVGFDAVDVAALNQRSIALAIVGDVNSRSVAEHTMMLILSLAKRSRIYDRMARSGGWNHRNSLEAVELFGKTLLVVGFGRIGRKVAELGQAFGMRVLVNDPFLDPLAIRGSGVTYIGDFTQALKIADIVSLHTPLADGGPLIGERQLACMKASAIIVNAARGGLIDEAALAAALDGGRLAGAGLDVFEAEPPTPDHPLLASDRVVLSPHSASLTQECAARMSIAAAQNILDFFADRLDPNLIVNATALAAADPGAMV